MATAHLIPIPVTLPEGARAISAGSRLILLDLILTLGEAREGAYGLAAAAERLRLAKSSVSRSMRALEAAGLVRVDSGTGKGNLTYVRLDF